MDLKELRRGYHEAICQQLLGYMHGIPNIASAQFGLSTKLVDKILANLELAPCPELPEREAAEDLFALVTRNYLEQAFGLLQHLRPGDWTFSTVLDLGLLNSYDDSDDLMHTLAQHPELRVTLRDQLLIPDIVMACKPVSDREINRNGNIVNGQTARSTPVREVNQSRPVSYAYITCKWTLRSDRAQNASAEALNIISNRKGNLPHRVAVVAEPLPTRIAALALGTGDLDCVYHFALHELKQAVEQTQNEDQLDMLNILLRGRRLRDISDLPFDLAI